MTFEEFKNLDVGARLVHYGSAPEKLFKGAGTVVRGPDHNGNFHIYMDEPLAHLEEVYDKTTGNPRRILAYMNSLTYDRWVILKNSPVPGSRVFSDIFGMFGTVKGVTELSLSRSLGIIVEFDTPDPRLHDCNGRTLNKQGYYYDYDMVFNSESCELRLVGGPTLKDQIQTLWEGALL